MNRIRDNLICTGTNRPLVEALSQAGVEFVVIGGLAVSWYCPTRQADDMDLLVNPTPENSQRVASTLNGLKVIGYNSNSFAMPGVQAQLKQTHYAELFTPKDDGPTYTEVEAAAVSGNLFNVPVRIASAASLIRLKESAIAALNVEREKHIRDIELLKQHGV